MSLRLGLEFESWGGHSVTPLTGTEPNILKTNDVPTHERWKTYLHVINWHNYMQNEKNNHSINE